MRNSISRRSTIKALEATAINNTPLNTANNNGGVNKKNYGRDFKLESVDAHWPS